jgi:ATP/maltotriose-dependent transcriptional regulator MalT
MGAACDLARFYCDEGRWDEAEECLAYHRDVAAPGHVVLAAWRLAVTARFLAHRGELAAATDLAERAVEVAESTDMPNVRAAAWLALAEVTRAGDRTAEADVAMATALELYEQKGNVAAAERLRGTSAVLA